MDDRIINALAWLTSELSNLMSHYGMTTGENEGMKRGEFFEANKESMLKHLYSILEIPRKDGE